MLANDIPLGRRWGRRLASLASMPLGCFALLVLGLVAIGEHAHAQSPEEPSDGIWLTSADRSRLLARQDFLLRSAEPVDRTVEVALERRCQRMDGFGATLTDGSIQAIESLPWADQESLLDELFLPPPRGLGWNVIRLPVGASDLSDHVYTYNDSDTPDPELKRFDAVIARERVVPLLQRIAKRSPDILWMATPWTAPSWMKDDGQSKGGALRREHYAAYAKYWVMYLRLMESHGIRFAYLTVQNEPENPHNQPSMLMTAAEQAEFIGEHLGPALQGAEFATRILAFDHNCDHPEYPMAVLGDRRAGPFTRGSAFHLYAGQPSAMSQVHAKFPDREIHFTEQWVSSDGDFGGDLMWHAENVLIGATRNWAQSVLEWNVAADGQQRPHTDGGCDKCLGALTIDGGVRRNVAYYILAHGSRFVPPGSQRLETRDLPNGNASMPAVAFLTPQGQLAVILVNPDPHDVHVEIRAGAQTLHAHIPARTLATLVSSLPRAP